MDLSASSSLLGLRGQRRRCSLDARTLGREQRRGVEPGTLREHELEDEGGVGVPQVLNGLCEPTLQPNATGLRRSVDRAMRSLAGLGESRLDQLFIAQLPQRAVDALPIARP